MRTFFLRTACVAAVMACMAQVTGAVNPISSKTQYAKSNYNITLTLPQGFTVHDKLCLYGVNMAERIDARPALPYWFSATDKTSDCMLLYSDMAVVTDMIKEGFGKGRDFNKCSREIFEQAWKGDMYAATNTVFTPYDKPEYQKKWEKNIERLSKAEADEWFHADSVYVIEFPVTTPYKGVYNHVVGIYMIRNNNIPVFVKMLLNDKGYMRKQLFLNAVRKSLRY